MLKMKIKKEETQEIERLKKENQEFLNQLKRAVADYRNLEVRATKERTDFVRYANEDLFLKILPLFEDLEKAATHFKDQALELIVNQFKKVLAEYKIEEIGAEGEDFDPHIHDCIEVEEGGEGKVTKVLGKGYKLQDKVILPAKVKVGKKQAVEIQK
ncbi:nucleotide exchange factor GrpE [candidate division WWE3 bacterium CG06_land_8_20_14_3_00_42_16]|uniref:Protein GrpE n=1 Tax=candidate division WWE3 bacterium CG06_land_8_20_14_3_00_42_16 TaxID=1975083 RepID=A0A2M7APD3_UNCKA|nr:MAG: nucleotide exchange factor GrpE [bacterium CG1_02_42_9]PIU69261.1 MAG: nucleotide exchange factor GrpE [candidate division WWE3 bacterium CG06_land_8_20_14_3_00_42_16]